jgi:dTDP-4-dehydrorhamnose 3,5-epimerase
MSGELDVRPLPLAGAFAVTAVRHEDERGWFARSWSAAEFAERGLNPVIAQTSLSFNPRRGTLRGLHYQASPYEEAKLVTCIRGTIWDVMVDLRLESTTFRDWYGEELDGGSSRALYVPEGFAHGFLTVSDDALVLYQISQVQMPSHARGIRWDDPSFAIEWPAAPIVISAKDRSHPDFDQDPGT